MEWFDLLDDPTGIAGGRGTFNDAGQFTFQASFTDGSQGIFIATIPEPTTSASIALEPSGANCCAAAEPMLCPKRITGRRGRASFATSIN